MYNKNGGDRSYEDAIHVKRSRRSERTRSELRRNSARMRDGLDFSISKNAAAPSFVCVASKTTAQSGEKKIAVGRPVPRPASAVERLRSENDIKTEAHADSVKGTVQASRKISAPRKIYVNSSELQKMNLHIDDADSFDALDTEQTLVENNSEVKSVVNDAVSKDDTSSSVRTDRDDETEGKYVSVAGLRTISRAVVDNENIKKTRLTAGKVIRRSLLSLFTAIILLVATLFGALAIAANGPSPTVRDFLVLSALHASATKWVPGIFLDDEVVDQILKDSQKVNTDVISVDEYTEQQKEEDDTDKWANAIDGMIYESLSGPTFKGYVLLVRDPSRVSVGVATDHFSDTNEGMRIFDMADKYGAVAAINGGEYPDAGGMGIGGRPIGLTYSDGKCVWSDGLRRSFMGFDKNDRLIVREGLTKAQAEELGIRDGVCFQTGKTLITNDNGNVTMYYADHNTGIAQRTAIGQTADGTVILLVTDGRTASSLGATHNDVIDIMVSYGAISAGMLDGGSSSLMYYRDFYDKYGLDKTDLDEYQRRGLINKYKAFTNPRRLPTCFIVAPE
ncbi:MAG: phosphodiester glycosidase family protein [Ruminococcaceae bacterium]|nr:phosphodiester glycosidase family protein [Oscillospiraceae bacterium]